VGSKLIGMGILLFLANVTRLGERSGPR
jgi:hypothetical protein